MPRHRSRLLVPSALGMFLAAAGVVPVAAQNFVAVQDSTNPIVAATASGAYTGAAWVDVDGDGLLDLSIVNKAPIYHNLGGGQFALAPQALPGQNQNLGMTWADYDDDGDLDCYLSGNNVANGGSVLYRNDGAFHFTKITAGDVGNSQFNSGWGCAFGDFDDDAHVDIVVAAANNFGGVHHPNRLLHNNGDGTFTNVDTTAVTDTLDAFTIPTWSDYDLDGDIDLFIGSGRVTSLHPDNLFRNVLAESGHWGFARITTAPIATDSLDGQVWNWIDYDNDGDLDACQTNYTFSVPNHLYRNDAGTYVRMTPADVGTIASAVGSALANDWGDFDNDGDLDCLVTNDGATPCQLFLNNGDGTFTQDVSSPIATAAGPHYGVTAGDYDRDGDLDLYVHGTTATKRLYRNDLPGTNGWLEITLTGAGAPGGSNPSALGAKVRAKAVIGGRPVWQFREVSAQNSFNSMNMLDVHFGLGDASVVDSLVVEWPAGGVQVFRDVPARRVYRIREGVDPTAVPTLGAATSGVRLGRNTPNPFAASTTIEYELGRPARAQLAVYDVGGRLVRTLVAADLSAGRHAAAWDGRDDAGRAVGSGVYFARLSVAGERERAARRMTLAR
ncbi:MAG: FG-GAP-like repeat-containing protein [bacterium]